MVKQFIFDVVDRIRLLRRNKRFGIDYRFCDIPIGLRIPEGTIFLHKGLGVVIAKATVLGENVSIYQFVTLGGRGKEACVGKEFGCNDAPVIGDGVKLYAYSSVFGGVTIGHDCVVGAYSMVVNDVPPCSLVMGIPGKVVKSLCLS